MNLGSGITCREDKSSGIEILIAEAFAKTNPTEPLRLANPKQAARRKRNWFLHNILWEILHYSKTGINVWGNAKSNLRWHRGPKTGGKKAYSKSMVCSFQPSNSEIIWRSGVKHGQHTRHRVSPRQLSILCTLLTGCIAINISGHSWRRRVWRLKPQLSISLCRIHCSQLLIHTAPHSWDLVLFGNTFCVGQIVGFLRHKSHTHTPVRTVVVSLYTSRAICLRVVILYSLTFSCFLCFPVEESFESWHNKS
jgi:hypothetical protein